MGAAGDTAATSHLIRSIARVDLRVQDVDRALAFYRDLVGLEVSAHDTTTATFIGAEARELLHLDASGVEAPARRDATGLFHTAFRYPDRASLGKALGRLVERGMEVGAGDHGVSEALYVDDPDGNGVELYWDRPREVWPAPAPGQRVGMYSAPVDLRSVLEEGRTPGDAAPPLIGHVHLQVRDIPETLRFYVDRLGLDLMATMGDSAAFLSSFGYHHHVGANVWNSRGRQAAPRTHAGLDCVVLEVPSEDELEGARARLRAADAAVDREDDELVVSDPNGIELRLKELAA